MRVRLLHKPKPNNYTESLTGNKGVHRKTKGKMKAKVKELTSRRNIPGYEEWTAVYRTVRTVV